MRNELRRDAFDSSLITHHSSLITMNISGNTAAVEEPMAAARRIFSPAGPELALVEEGFGRQSRSNIQATAYIGDYLRRLRSKRVRTALTLLANRAVGGD